MKYIFYLEYHTNWGEEVRLLDNSEELGGNSTAKALPMSTHDGRSWQLTIDLKETTTITYHYLITCHGKVMREEALYFNRTLPKTKSKLTIIHDKWYDKPQNSPNYSFAFTKVWKRQENRDQKNTEEGLVFGTFCSQVKSDQVLALLGNHHLLGNWDSQKALVLDGSTNPYWTGSISYEELLNEGELIYKYVILNKETRAIEAWEEGENRIYSLHQQDKKALLIQMDKSPLFYQENWRVAGLTVPVFSLRSKNSWGIGEFTDIKTLVDWAEKSGLKLVQLLPVNDTTLKNTWDDSYPYRCTSVFALNPIYLNLDLLGINESPMAESYQTLKKELNELIRIDFPTVQAKKQEFTRELFKLNGKETLTSDAFSTFFKEHSNWLEPYAIYLYLREKYATVETSKWKEYSIYSNKTIDEFCTANKNAQTDLNYTYYIQYHLYKQLKEASLYAQSKGIVLKGDLPIGISLHSADAWVNSRYFHINGQAGAPPDDFAIDGQNWGFPTYNWTEIANDDFSWWKKRLNYMSEFFQAYRIDHILGFFRIWTIPRTAIYGTLGQFDPALPIGEEELQALGFDFDKKRHTEPYIKINQLDDIKLTPALKKSLFMQSEDGFYHFKENVNNQVKLNEYLQTVGTKKVDDITKKQLLSLHTELLFLEDMNESGLYHPRIDTHKTEVYKSLSSSNQAAFDRIYHNFFYVKHNYFWKKEALIKLPKLIQSSQMLVCGEDLGMIPQSVPEVMKSLDILRLEIERMPKTAGLVLDNPDLYPYQSVSAFSTHDMSTIRGWWEENPSQAALLYKEIYAHEGSIPEKLSPEIAYAILNRELCGQSMLSIQALQDWLALTDKHYQEIPAEKEQINVPANIQNHWEYRMPGYLEDLLEDDILISQIKSLLSKSERN